MDFQFWLYLIIGVIYFLSRVLKKQVPQAPNGSERSVPQRPAEANRPQTDKPRPLTFEELLKEITEAKQPVKPVFVPQSREIKQEPVVDYDDDLGEEAQDLETIEPDYRTRDNRSYEVYEESKRQAFARPSLEETMNVRDTDMQFGKFKAFEQQKQRNLLEEYTMNFQDPEGLKKAIVMSEILKTKF
jgi:hypothetical protein